MAGHIGKWAAATFALAVALTSPSATAEAGGPPAVRVEGAGIEEPFLLDSGNWTNDYSAMRIAVQSIAPARLEAVQRGLVHRPRIDVQVYYRYASPCAREAFVFRRECATQVIEFYPAYGSEPAVFAQELTNWGMRGRVWMPSEFALDHMASLGIPTRIEVASLSTEAQAGWIAAAALVGLVLAAPLAPIARVVASTCRDEGPMTQ